MRWPCLFALPVACSLAVTPGATQSFIVPSQQSARAGNWFDDTLTPVLANQPAHVQLIYDTQDIQPPATVVRQMEFRRTISLLFGPIPNPATTWDITLVLAMGPNGPATASSTFAANLGTLQTAVFSGRVNLPFDVATANPPPFTVQIPFTTPFLYLQAAGAGLVADFRVTGYSAQQPWRIDSHVPNFVVTGTNGGPDTRCRLGGNGNTGDFTYNGLLVTRSAVSLGFTKLLPGAFGILALGATGQGGTWRGLPLPYDLGPLGAPGCFLRTSMELAFAVQCDAAGSAFTPTIVIPPELGNTGFYYFQGIFLDPAANALGLMTTGSPSFTIGNSDPPKAARVSRLADTGMSPTGIVERHAVVARFVP